MGLVEVGQRRRGTVDTTEVGDLNPNAKAIIALNPHSAHIAVTRVDGVTSAVSLPTGGLISGQAAIINLVGTTPQEMAVVPYAALVINFPRTGRRGGEFGAEQQPDVNLSDTADSERETDRSDPQADAAKPRLRPRSGCLRQGQIVAATGSEHRARSAGPLCPGPASGDSARRSRSRDSRRHQIRRRNEAQADHLRWRRCMEDRGAS